MKEMLKRFVLSLNNSSIRMDLRSFDSYTFFPGQHWNHTWERQHEIVTRFAEYLEAQVIHVSSPLGAINHNPFSVSFIKRVLQYRTAQQKVEQGAGNPVLPNMIMINAFHIPFHSELIGRINFGLMKNKMGMSSNNFFWATYANPTVYEFFKASKYKIYDIAERRSRNPYLSQTIKDLERKIVAEADIVFVDNHAVMADYSGLNNNMYYVPQGVNTDSFFPLNDKREYIGYIGNFHSAIDYDYLERLIMLNPQERFLFIGAVLDNQAERVFKYGNVTHINQIPKNELNRHLAKMKVGLIPYVKNELTMGVYPTKLFEYLSAKVPVISTSIPEVSQYANDSYLRIMDSPESLSNISFDMVGVSNVIDQNTWDERWRMYIKKIEQ